MDQGWSVSCQQGQGRTLTIELSEFGRGNGFAAKDFTVATSTIFKVFVNEDNVETVITQVP